MVDVAITAYRHARYVGEAIQSVLAQTFGDWRLTIFENGPGGGEIERAVAPYLSDPRVAYRAWGAELPVDANFTRAIRHGTAKYVALLHDDDRWHPDFLAARVAALDANPQCAFAFSGWVQINEHGVAGELSPLRFANGVLSRAALARALVHRNPVVASTAVVRRSAYEAVGAAFERRWLFCDWEMWARLAAQFPAFYLARRDTDFRRHLQSNTFATREEPEPLLELADHIERLLATHLDNQHRGRIERARRRSRILLRAASDVHTGGGWRVSGALYRRALREHPPTVLHRRSLRMLSYTVLGRSTAVALARIARRWLRIADHPRWRPARAAAGVTTMHERDLAALRRHFDIERELADRLRAASAAERQSLYAVVYEELFRRVPDHPQHTRKAEPGRQAADAQCQLRLLRHFMTDATVYLEIGAGDGYLTRAVAEKVKHAYAVDVSEIIADADSLPANFTRLNASGTKLDIARESIDLAYGNQLIEHLHTEDAMDHLREVARTLRPGGRYVIITPHRYSGPHDISKYFSDEPQGFHLHEYSYGEMIERLRASGFTGREAWTGIKAHFFRLPLFLVLGIEKFLGLLPRGLCRWLASRRPLRIVLENVVVVGIK